MFSQKTFSEGSMQSAVSDTDVSNNLLCVQQMFTEVGVYRKNLVAIRRVKEERLNLTKTDLKELTAVRLDICDTAQGKDAPRGNFLILYAEYLGRYDKV